IGKTNPCDCAHSPRRPVSLSVGIAASAQTSLGTQCPRGRSADGNEIQIGNGRKAGGVVMNLPKGVQTAYRLWESEKPKGFGFKSNILGFRQISPRQSGNRQGG
ncbi:MAG: hypothetical protein B7Z55_12875, partial [Planctomycetales bacterium 12-60-4]